MYTGPIVRSLPGHRLCVRFLILLATLPIPLSSSFVRVAGIRGGLAATASVGVSANVSAAATVRVSGPLEDWQPRGPSGTRLDKVDSVPERSCGRGEG